MEGGMSGSPSIDRACRNALKAGGLIVGAILASGAVHNLASAAPGGNGNGNGGTNGNGGNSGGNPGNGNNGGNCFARGTQILTSEGYRPIETLVVGDKVATHFAGFAPIKQMVTHSLNRVSGKWSGNPHNLPVVVRRGALGENVPAADLCLTALHAVYIDGFLMNVGDLVNGASIAFDVAGGEGTLDFFIM
jgi:hypothetical protein